MIGFSAAPLLLYPTHYIGDDGYFSDTEDTLSFDGEDVTRFRLVKEKERALQRAEEDNIDDDDKAVKTNKITPKTEADSSKHLGDVSDNVASINEAIHGEL